MSRYVGDAIDNEEASRIRDVTLDDGATSGDKGWSVDQLRDEFEQKDFYTPFEYDEDDSYLDDINVWGDTSVGIKDVVMRGWYSGKAISLNCKFTIHDFSHDFPNDDSFALSYIIKNKIIEVIPDFDRFPHHTNGTALMVFGDKTTTVVPLKFQHDRVTISHGDFGGVTNGADGTFTATSVDIIFSINTVYRKT